MGGNIGIDRDLEFTGETIKARPPHMLSYSANLVVYAPRDSGAAPYVTGGVGGLTLFEQREVGMLEDTTLFAGNIGGGVKVDLNDRWGIRADYRFIPVASKDDAPAFCGRETRYGHHIAVAALAVDDPRFSWDVYRHVRGCLESTDQCRNVTRTWTLESKSVFV